MNILIKMTRFSSENGNTTSPNILSKFIFLFLKIIGNISLSLPPYFHNFDRNTIHVSIHNLIYIYRSYTSLSHIVFMSFCIYMLTATATGTGDLHFNNNIYDVIAALFIYLFINVILINSFRLVNYYFTFSLYCMFIC